MSAVRVRAYAPGRVNLIGEHTDYTGGLALPVAIDRGTTVTGVRRDDGGPLTLTSDAEPGRAVVHDRGVDPATVSPRWARYLVGVAAQLQLTPGFDGEITSDLLVGAGLSSSASLVVALALALGFDGPSKDLVEVAHQAEHRATGVAGGRMDQLAVVLGQEGHALLIDFSTGAVEPTPLPPDAEIVVVPSGEHRSLEDSAYNARHDDCVRATARIGPLAQATVADVATLDDPVLRKRARHVVTENERVRVTAAALAAGDLATVGAAMDAGHASLRDDYEVSTATLDELVTHLRSRPGVWGARLTGAGFGGCAVALTEPGALDPRWVVRASAGASLIINPS